MTARYDAWSGWRSCWPTPDFEVVGAAPRGGRVPATGCWTGLPAEVVEQALWWERHIVEVIHGLRAGRAAGTRPRPEYDPARHVADQPGAGQGRRAGRGRARR